MALADKNAALPFVVRARIIAKFINAVNDLSPEQRLSRFFLFLFTLSSKKFLVNNFYAIDI